VLDEWLRLGNAAAVEVCGLALLGVSVAALIRQAVRP